MNTSKNIIRAMLAVSAMTFIPMGAQAGQHSNEGQQFQADKRYHRHEYGMGILKQLDLSDTQKTQIKAIMDQQRSNMRGHIGERRAHREEMRNLVESANFDRSKAAALIVEQQEKEREMKLAMLQAQHEIYKVLSPEQREKARILRAEYRAKK
ncbi:MAG TPA: Spy/CpxP family protein refolding chaperone [Limnobacter sp.]|nr:Spy/CpxP family protein refolding chaperone [Limnobacter sp.]